MVDRPSLTPERLAELLARLDEVMDDAARLRSEVSRQLKDLGGKEPPKVPTPRRRGPKHR
jgi:hypothetical protein